MSSIDIFPWDDNFKVGIKKIDEQHHKLVEIINNLATQFSFNPHSINLDTIFDELVEYTHYHFETEELIWEAYFHDEVSHEEHKITHKNFIDSLSQLLKEQSGKSVQEVAENMLDMLVHWLVGHILESDRYLAYRVLSLEEGSTLEESKNIAEEKMAGYNREMTKVVMKIYEILSHNTLRLMRELDLQSKIKKELSEKEQLLRTVIDEIPDILVLKDSEGKFLLANQAVANLYNTTTDEMLGKDDSDFGVSKEMSDFFRQNILDIMKKDKPEVVYEDSLDAKTNEIHHFRSIKRPFKDKDGKNQILIIAQDITSLIEIQKELQHQQVFLNTLVNSIPAFVWLKDIDGRYMMCNAKFLSAFNLEEKDIVGKTDYDLVEKHLADSLRKHDKDTIKENTLKVQENRILFPTEKTHKLIESNKVPMYDKEGKLIGVLGIGHDITKKRQTEERLEYALNGSSDGLWDWNMQTNEVYFSPRWLEMIGYENDNLPQTFDSWNRLLHPDDKELIIKQANDYINGKTDKYEVEFRMQHKNGKWIYVLARGKLVTDVNGNLQQPPHMVGTHVDITSMRQYEIELEHLAHFDPLTNLPNRLLLADRLQQAMLQSNRSNNTIAVVYIDIDGFKEVNDNYGHDIGDKLLIDLAKRMQKSLRENDTLSRFGGDEFVAVLQDLDEHSTVIQILQRLLESVAENLVIEGISINVSASVGISFYPQDKEISSDGLIRQADHAMYQAKQSGKNRYFIFDTKQDQVLKTLNEKIDRIEKAYNKQEFILYYQPKVNMRTGKIIGAEALIRWNHPERGILAPVEFLPTITSHSLSIVIGSWVIETAMKQLEEWNNMGIKIPLSVNLDPMQLEDDSFLDNLDKLLEKYPSIEKGDLEFEMLETSALEEISHIVHIIDSCHARGIGFSIDDFGTGYSSLTYLKRLPAKTLKIDQSFIFDIFDDTEDLAIVEGILELAKTFNRKVIAEGIESIEHGRVLLLLGCELAQGYQIAKPMSSDNLLHWYETWKLPEEWSSLSNRALQDFSLIYAMVEHRKWIKEVINYLINDTQNCLPVSLDENKCKFAKWIKAQGDKIVDSEIVEFHSKLHQDIQTLLKEHQNNNIKITNEHIKQLEKDRNYLIDLLFKMI